MFPILKYTKTRYVPKTKQKTPHILRTKRSNNWTYIPFFILQREARNTVGEDIENIRFEEKPGESTGIS